MKPSEKTQIQLARIKSWYVPANTQSYQALRMLHMPLLKVHGEFLPTLEMAVHRSGQEYKVVPFSETLNAYLDKIGTVWQSRPKRKCLLGEQRLVFTAPMTLKNKEAVSKLDVSLARFFARWGFSYHPEYSSVGERLKLVVDYKFDPNRNPVIQSVEQEDVRPFELVLGFTKIKITFRDKHQTGTAERKRSSPPIILVEVFTQSGSDWRLVHTSTCVDQQIGDTSQFLAALSILFDRTKVIDARS